MSVIENAAKQREALESIADNLERRLFAKYPSSATDEWMWQKAKSALAAPSRNCDRFGGDPKKLHDEWWEWSGRTENCNADGTVKLTYGEWLLATTTKKDGVK